MVQRLRWYMRTSPVDYFRSVSSLLSLPLLPYCTSFAQYRSSLCFWFNRPRFLFLCMFQSSVYLAPIQLHFCLFTITSSLPNSQILHKTAFEIKSGHLMFRILRDYRFRKIWIFWGDVAVTLQVLLKKLVYHITSKQQSTSNRLLDELY